MTTANPYGTDIRLIIGSDGSLDIDPAGLEVSGIAVLAQALVMAQMTGPGSVLAVPDQCIDIRSWLSKGMTPTQIQQLGSVVQSQLLKDQRVKAATVIVQYDSAHSTITLLESISSSAGPFTLTLVVSKVTASFLLNGQPLGGS
jgi:hypothetical protein